VHRGERVRGLPRREQARVGDLRARPDPAKAADPQRRPQISTFWIDAANGAIIPAALLIQRATGEKSEQT
jgi:hypothetical protein